MRFNHPSQIKTTKIDQAIILFLFVTVAKDFLIIHQHSIPISTVLLLKKTP
jgi:hypothetical protein